MTLIGLGEDGLGGLTDASRKALAEAEADPNITVHNWSDEERAKFRKLGTEEWQKIAGQSPMAQQVYDTLIAYLNDKGMLE